MASKLLKDLILIPAIFALPGFYSCTAGSAASVADVCDGDTLTHHSRLLTLVRCDSGVILADIANPWAEGRFLGRFAITNSQKPAPQSRFANRRLIHAGTDPLAVYSAVHASAIEELDASSQITAVAEQQFFSGFPTIVSRLKDSTITDIGTPSMPSAELLLKSGAKLVLRSPMEGMAAPALPAEMQAVEMADYLETSPVARAEWILLLGALTGNYNRADSIFNATVANYSVLALKAAMASSPKPTVLTDTEYCGIWYVPAGKSYAAAMLRDAGAIYPWADTDGSASLALSFEKVAEKARNADIWLLRTFGYKADAASLLKQNPKYAVFKALANGDIYSVDTEQTPVFVDMAFHPDRVLADYVAIFHPEMMPGYKHRYFTK